MGYPNSKHAQNAIFATTGGRGGKGGILNSHGGSFMNYGLTSPQNGCFLYLFSVEIAEVRHLSNNGKYLHSYLPYMNRVSIFALLKEVPFVSEGHSLNRFP